MFLNNEFIIYSPNNSFSNCALASAHSLIACLRRTLAVSYTHLAGENKALFLRFCNVYAEFMGESELDTFITGFRLGARFMMDTFLSDDAPFESFLSG